MVAFDHLDAGSVATEQPAAVPLGSVHRRILRALVAVVTRAVVLALLCEVLSALNRSAAAVRRWDETVA